MRWRLFATFAEAAGDTEVEVPVSTADPTVGDALEALFQAYPELEERVLDDDGTLAEHVRLLHEGADPRVSGDGLDTPVEEGDELGLFPPVSGG